MPRMLCLTLVVVPFLAGAARAQSSSAPRWTAAVDSMMVRELARTRTPGAQIAIVERGRLAYTKGYGVADIETGRPVTDRTLFQTASVGKLFTGVLLAQLASAGVVDMRAPISRYVPEIAGHQVGTSTLHELLTHSAGWAAGAVPFGRSDEAALDEQFRTLDDTILVPGFKGVYAYSNPSFSMAAYVAERAGRRPFETLLDSLVLRPLGMTRSTHRPMLAMTYDVSLGHRSPAGSARMTTGDAAGQAPPVVARPMPGNSAEWGAGFMYSNAAETARLAIAMMNDGMIDGRRALAPDALRAVTTAYVPRAGFPGDSSGYGMYTIAVRGRRSWQKGGSIDGFRALVTMWPAEKFAVIVFTNRLSDVTYQSTAEAARIVAGIEPLPVETIVEREPTAAERAALVGSYRIRKRNIEIHESNGRLELRRVSYSVPIRMTGADRFVITPPGEQPITYLVKRDSTGAVRGLESLEQSYPRTANP
jgi:CubicO group peptidase (beta-lactamase class C family)